MRQNRWWLGPVFAFEWLVSTRRWQWYAVRSTFAALLLAALVVIMLDPTASRDPLDIQGLAHLGETFYIAVITTQITMILLAAPAATAGAIAHDRASGMMTHLLVTDLSAAEIVLGKLASRLVPVLGLVGCALPILAIMTLLGGVDSLALAGGLVVTLGLAFLGTTLACFLSLRTTKTHEALLGTYAIWAVWLLGRPGLWLFNQATGWSLTIPELLANPYRLAFAPYWSPTLVSPSDYGWFLLTTMALAGGLTVLTIGQVRAVCTQTKVSRPSRPGGLTRRLDRRWNLPSPRLDFNPVLWREWHRSRPSRFARVVVGGYAVGALAASIGAILSPWPFARAWVNALQVALGMLGLSVIASSSLAEERVRGGLDVLLTTPLSTTSIVVGKWLGTFRLVGWLAVLPVLVVLSGDSSSAIYLPAALLTLLYIFVGAALIAALGLLMATWCRRPGRAVAYTVTLYLLVTVAIVPVVLNWIRGPRSEEILMCSPFFFAGCMAGAASVPQPRTSPIAWGTFWLLVDLIGAMGLLGVTLLTFNRCLGRAGSADWPRLGRTVYPPELGPMLAATAAGHRAAGRPLRQSQHDPTRPFA